MYLLLYRLKDTCQYTQGRLFLFDGADMLFNCCSLELPWRANKKNISRIPPGIYATEKRYSIKYSDHIHILGVPGRSMILIHAGNFTRQTRGCVLIGKYFKDIDSDGLPDVCQSRMALKNLTMAMGDNKKMSIIIRDPEGII